jgi:hypothetical protein
MSKLTTNEQEKSESRELSVQELEAVTGGFFGRALRTGQLQPQGTTGAILGTAGATLG